MMKVLIGIGGAMILTAAPASGQPPRSAPGETVRPDEQDALQWAASVVQMTELRNQGRASAKLFGVAGGDPAMNGLQTYLAFYISPADGFRIFRVADILNYAVLSEAPGRVTLSVRENVMGASGTIGVRWRRLTISWQIPSGEQAPRTIAIAAAAGR